MLQQCLVSGLVCCKCGAGWLTSREQEKPRDYIAEMSVAHFCAQLAMKLFGVSELVCSGKYQRKMCTSLRELKDEKCRSVQARCNKGWNHSLPMAAENNFFLSS